jgi:hypothetical protein
MPAGWAARPHHAEGSHASAHFGALHELQMRFPGVAMGTSSMDDCYAAASAAAMSLSVDFQSILASQGSCSAAGSGSWPQANSFSTTSARSMCSVYHTPATVQFGLADLPSMVRAAADGFQAYTKTLRLKHAPDGIFRECYRGEIEGAYDNYIHWFIRLTTLEDGNRQQLVSDEFHLPLSEQDDKVPFKLIITAKESYLSKGGHTFKKAKFTGKIELKSFRSSFVAGSALQFSLMVGSSSRYSGKQQPVRGPIEHDFSQRCIGGLPQKQEIWNFKESVDEETDKFIVSLRVFNLKSSGGFECEDHLRQHTSH